MNRPAFALFLFVACGFAYATEPLRLPSDAISSISAELRNDGDVSGVFNYHAECSGITVMDSQKSITLSPGQTATVSIAVIGSNLRSSDAPFTCTIVSQSANSDDTVRSPAISGSIMQIFKGECPGAAMIDYANNRCSCPLESVTPEPGEFLNLTACAFQVIPQPPADSTPFWLFVCAIVFIAGMFVARKYQH